MSTSHPQTGARLARLPLETPGEDQAKAVGERSQCGQQALGRTCLPWPSALLCGQPSARWARGKLGSASAAGLQAGAEPLPQEAAQSAPAFPDVGPAPSLCHHHFGRRSTRSRGSPRLPQAGPGRRGKGGRGAGRGLGISRALLSESPFSYGPLGYHSVSHF